MTGRLRRVGAVVHPDRPGALTLGKDLGRWAQDHGITLRTLTGERGCLGFDTEHCEEHDLAPGCDLIVALGGDGTLLRAARLALPHEVPVLGVNLGRLGFLTEVEPSDLTPALEQVLTGAYTIDRRTALEVSMASGQPPDQQPGQGADQRSAAGPAADLGASGLGGGPLTAYAINDLVLEKVARQRLVGVAVRIDGRLFARYAADGVIVATPTGSTAYSFSAGGPIVVPQLDAIMLTPIAPHMVFNRPLVLHPGQTLTLEVLPVSSESAVEVDVAADGRTLRRLSPGATVVVRRAARDALLVRLDGTDFFRRVRSKFQLADAGVASEDTNPPPSRGDEGVVRTCPDRPPLAG